MIMALFYCTLHWLPSLYLSHPSLLVISLSCFLVVEELLCGGCNNGICDEATGKCKCEPGFVGDHCSCKCSTLLLSPFSSLSHSLSLPLSDISGCVCGVCYQSVISVNRDLCFFSSCLWLVCCFCVVLCCISLLCQLICCLSCVSLSDWFF